MLFKSFKLTLKSILVNMAANDELPMDMNQLNIDDVVNKALESEPLTIFVATISNEGETLSFAGKTREELDEKLAGYCKENWSNVEAEDDIYVLADNENIIRLYFDTEWGAPANFIEFAGEVDL